MQTFKDYITERFILGNSYLQIKNKNIVVRELTEEEIIDILKEDYKIKNIYKNLCGQLLDLNCFKSDKYNVIELEDEKNYDTELIFSNAEIKMFHKWLKELNTKKLKDDINKLKDEILTINNITYYSIWSYEIGHNEKQFIDCFINALRFKDDFYPILVVGKKAGIGSLELYTKKLYILPETLHIAN